MMQAWWDAHLFEFVVAAGAGALIGVVLVIEALSDIRAERKQRRKDGLL